MAKKGSICLLPKSPSEITSFIINRLIDKSFSGIEFALIMGTSLLIISVYILVTLHTAHTDRIGFFLQTMGVILVLLGVSLLALSKIQLNVKKPKYKEDYAKWERLWYCSHCRNSFYDA